MLRIVLSLPTSMISAACMLEALLRVLENCVPVLLTLLLTGLAACTMQNEAKLVAFATSTTLCWPFSNSSGSPVFYYVEVTESNV